MSQPTESIRVDGLVRRIRAAGGPVEAVRGIDLTVEAGETVALLGPNGAGKSSTIDVLLGLADPTQGHVRVLGEQPRAAVAAGRVGAMLQTGSLIRDLSVREVVSMVASLYPSPLPVDEALSLAGLEHVAERRTQKLSGGETQRVRFAVAVVPDPDLLVLDEPTVAMDVEGRRTFWAGVRELAARGRTVLFATHFLEEADLYADRIVLMARGRIVAEGAPTDIKARVGGRTIRTTLDRVDRDALAALPGVLAVDARSDGATLTCSDADRALRALLDAHADARDIEVRGAGLEEAFLELTAESDEPGVAADAGQDHDGGPVR